MTNDDKIKALSGLDGWKWEARFCGAVKVWNNPPKMVFYDEDLPRYLDSYDAIIPLIQKQDMIVKASMCKLIGVKHDYCAWISATPSQICDALLRATGKWKE